MRWLQPTVNVPWWAVVVIVLLALPLFAAALVAWLLFWAVLWLIVGLDRLIDKARGESREEWLTRHGVRREW